MELCAIFANENAIVYCTPHSDGTKKKIAAAILPHFVLLRFYVGKMFH